MLQFKSNREKRLWIWTVLVLVAIFSSLGIARPFTQMLRDREMLSNLFWLAIFLVSATVFWHGIKNQKSRLEIFVWLGIFGVYLLVLLRMGTEPEHRTHLIEYSVVAVFIHEALNERKRNGGKVWRPWLLAILITSSIGILDECVQFFIPGRYFDPVDIGFNALAAAMAIGASSLLSWVRSKIASIQWKK